MDEKRLKEYEHYAGLMDYPADTEAMTDLIAEIRRLRGMVDGLLKDDPYTREHDCYWCGAYPGEKHIDCEWQRVVAARDWQPEEAKREDVER